MSENQLYLAVGEETTRGTPESTTVGFVPINSGAFPTYEPMDERRQEFRGEQSSLGDISFRRKLKKWSYTLDHNVFSETGTTAAIQGTLFKHLFGITASAQNAATGQYYHMMYPYENPFSDVANTVGDNGLTLNFNHTEEATVRNDKFYGGRIISATFTQEVGQLLKCSMSLVGQDVTPTQSAIATPTYAAENLRFDHADLTVYTGTITRTGTPPNYTTFAFGSATQLIPDKVEITIETGREDKGRLSGLAYPDKTTNGKFKVTCALTIDFEDPSAGFSSADERSAWLAANGTTNLFFHWDTGTQAGTGDNHQLYIDLPVCQRMGGDPEFSLERDPIVTLNYECDFDSTTTNYMIGCMLKNTASAI